MGIRLMGGMEVYGASPEQERILKGREAFVLAYTAKKGWNVDTLTIQQILEIRSQDGWKNPVAE